MTVEQKQETKHEEVKTRKNRTTQRQHESSQFKDIKVIKQTKGRKKKNATIEIRE